MSGMYLALTDGSTTINLTDGINYDIAGGWAPRFLAGREPLTVIETIPNINVLGRTSANPSVDDPAIVRRNLVKLIQMLEQIERGLWGDGSCVVLEYQSPGASPSRVLGAMLMRWDSEASTLPESFNDLEGLSTNTIEGITLSVERRTPWLVRRYTIENLASTTAWATFPTGWGGTWSAGEMPHGGMGSIALLSSVNYFSPMGFVSVTLGQTYTVRITIASASVVPTSMTIRFRNAGNTANISNAVVLSITNAGPIGTDGVAYTVELTATATDASARLQMVNGPNAVSIAEIAIFSGAGVTESWHPKYSEETAATIASAAVPVSGTLAFPIISPAPAPLDLVMAGMIPGASPPLGFGQMVCITTGHPNGIVSIDLPSGVMGGAFSSVAASALSSGNLLRFTCVVANQFEIAPRGVTIGDIVGAANIYQFRRAAVVAVVRSNSTSSMLMGFRGYTSVNTYDETPPVEIAYNSGQPQIVVLGVIYSQNGIYDYRLTVAGQTAGQTLDIDRITIAGLDDCGTLITTDAIATLVANSGVNISSNWLTGPAPTVDTAETGGLVGRAIIPSPDNALLRSRSITQRVYFDAVSAGFFRPTIDSVNVLSTSIAATRRTAFNNPV